MNQYIRSYFIILIYLAAGLVIVGTTQLLELPGWLNGSVIVLLFFVLLNMLTGKLLKLKDEIRTFWSLKKIIFLPIGILAGGVIALVPVLAVLLTGEITTDEVSIKTAVTASSIALTLVIVSWEELWFRGIFLNHCNRYLSAVNISVTNGLLFMLVHLLNPEINLLKTGPALFFAGAFLTSVYFYYKTIWLPVGLHFGNNYLSLQTPVEGHWLVGNEGYLGAVLPAILFFLVVKRMQKQDDKTKSS